MIKKDILPDGTMTYEADKVLQAIEEATTKKAAITCKKDKSGKLQFFEIRICVTKAGISLQDCTKASATCTAAPFIFASPPSPPPPPPLPRFVSSIWELEEAVEL
ncbi:uncharacterized protein LOC129296144 [Prosopis cineraria]|uniref:uncharacterized protein LOC129296144 n=1 Tax=Prosopis cineraria TaxID=364024 RepID=UPI00240FF744|nr:uncharacterized protein LOC129296144 [Prosopis cineraria]